MKVEWHLCGGFAIDSYLGEATRKHKDIDITVSFRDALECIKYLKSKGWLIDAPVGNGRFVDVDYALESAELFFDNIWCYKEGSSYVETERVDGIFKYMKFVNTEQTELDFIEVVFNKVDDDMFYYQKNMDITLTIDQAFIIKDGISILSPEIILLYKSRTRDNAECKHDFDVTINKLDKERYKWLINAMNIEYPDGHPWLVGSLFSKTCKSL